MPQKTGSGLKFRKPRNPGRKTGQKKHSRKSLNRFAQEKYRQANLLSRILGAIVIQAGGSYRLPKGAIDSYKPGEDKIDAEETETGLIITVTKRESGMPPLPPRPLVSPIIDPTTNRPTESSK